MRRPFTTDKGEHMKLLSGMLAADNLTPKPHCGSLLLDSAPTGTGARTFATLPEAKFHPNDFHRKTKFSNAATPSSMSQQTQLSTADCAS